MKFIRMYSRSIWKPRATYPIRTCGVSDNFESFTVREDVNFHFSYFSFFNTTSFPFLFSSLQSSIAPYVFVFASQSIFYSITWSNNDGFIWRALGLATEFLVQGYFIQPLRLSFRAFFCRSLQWTHNSILYAFSTYDFSCYNNYMTEFYLYIDVFHFGCFENCCITM